MPNNTPEIDIRNLTVSFRTNKGIVHAVRDISLSLEKGQTLAIVGESGSGKSVSAKAILGIEAPNAIIENGEILYQGQNLLTFTEEEFNHIRGNKITMIFQDPMSSLDPIVKIGPQMTEATLLNGITNQKLAKKELEEHLQNLTTCLIEAGILKSRVAENIKIFKNFNAIGSKLLAKYNTAIDYAESVNFDIQNIKNDLLEESKHPIVTELKFLTKKISHVYNDYFIKPTDERFNHLVERLNDEIGLYTPNTGDTKPLAEVLTSIESYIEQQLKKEVTPNFFTLGYYAMTKGLDKVDFTDAIKMNDTMRKTIDSEFMIQFIDDIATAIKYENERSLTEAKIAANEVNVAKELFTKTDWNIKECKAEIKKLSNLVTKAINRLSLHTDRAIYTLDHTLTSAVENYKATPEASKTNAKSALDDIAKYYEATIHTDEQYETAKSITRDAVAIIDNLKELESKAVYHVTKQMAYDKAIRIMEEVGIRNPRQRFNQYPFEFSGGMRQRIVIAIAIAANPDLLICDEPTTALDVTIQAQILELINRLKEKRNMSVIFITHDLGVVANVADKIAVMYAGKIVEKGTAEDIFYHPAHPYTWALLSSMPDLDSKNTLEAIPGTPPNMIYPPKGDAFAARNKYAMAIDFEMQPPMFKISETHYAATWLLHPDAPKVEPPKTVTERIARMKSRQEVNNA